MEKEAKAIPYKTIDEYMATLSDKQCEALETLRQIIKNAAPKAEETISYAMPAFRLHGMLVYFAAFKNHYSLFAANSTLTAQMADELGPYLKSKGTISFPYDKPLPVTLVQKIINARVLENEEKAAQKKVASKTKK